MAPLCSTPRGMDGLILGIVCGPGPRCGFPQLCLGWVFPSVPPQGEAGQALESARNGCELSLPVPSVTQHKVTPQPGKFREKPFSVSSNLPTRPLRAGHEMTVFSAKTSFGRCNRTLFFTKNSVKSILLLFSTTWVKSATRFWLFESQGRVLKYFPSLGEESQHSSEPEHWSRPLLK